MVKKVSHEFKAELRQKIVQYFTEEEVRTLCFDLGVEYADLPATGRSAKVRELVTLIEDRSRLPELLDQLRRLRPNVDWSEITYTTGELEKWDEEPDRRSLPPWAIGGLAFLFIFAIVAVIVAIAWPDNDETAMPTRSEPTEVPTEIVVLKPDLVVYEIKPVDRDTVRCYFRNVGDGEVPYQEILLVVEVMGDRVSEIVGLDSSKFPLIPKDEDYVDVNVTPISESVDARCIIDDTNTVDETNEGNNELVQRFEIREQQVRLESIVFEDGRITNEGVVDNGAPYIGDYPNNTAVRGFLSFDLSDIPAGAEILEASLLLGAGSRIDWKGNLVYATHRWFEIYDYAYGSLEPADYDGGPAERIIGFDIQKLEPIDLRELIQEKVAAGADRLQLRMQMSVETDNDDTGDRVGFLNSDLVVTYWFWLDGSQ